MYKKRLLKLADLLMKNAKNKKGMTFDLNTWGVAAIEDGEAKEPEISCNTTGTTDQMIEYIHDAVCGWKGSLKPITSCEGPDDDYDHLTDLDEKTVNVTWPAKE